ncbi:MAG: PAS domain S-box protein, partial [Holophagae bacterium]|nr:PAS domain S-box protein [Holophagae bacterium]
RKKAEADRERLSIAIEQAGEAIIITDKEATIQYVNPAYEKITGYTSEEVIGENPRILNSGVQDGAFYKKMWETLASGEAWSGRLVNRKKDGTLYTEETTISPVFDLSGKVVNYVGVKRDVTQELTMEEQFRQSQKMEAVGKLAGGVAHDFNNLLGVIMGYTELAQNQIGPDHGISKHLKAIERAAERSAGLTRQLLAFSRKQKLESKVINLNDLLKNLEKMLRRVIGEDIEFMTAYTDDLDKVEADPGQIEQIIMNLAVNARDAMPEGGKLTIESANVYLDERYARTHLGTIPGRYVMLAVLDTGSGMDEETRSRIFEPFFTTKEEGKGTGLGLSTVYGIVKQSGGHIWCYSEPDKGTTFEVYLPRTDAGLSRKKEGNAVKIAQGGSENILLVEDETEIRHLLKEMLKELNYNITVAENGIEALHLIEGKGFRPDLIITDVVMPHMGGKSLVDRVRKIVPDQKVLYMSGYTDHSAVQNGALDPDIPFIQKPFNFPDIAEKIKQALSGKG